MEIPTINGIEDSKLKEILVDWFEEKGIGEGLGELYLNDVIWKGEFWESDSVTGLVYSIEQNLTYDRLSKVVYYIYTNNGLSGENEDYITALYYRNGYEIDATDSTNAISTHIVKEPETQEQMKSWLKRNAPTEVYEKIRSAYDELRVSPDDAIEDCRQAFEKMLTKQTTLNKGLNQLVGNGLITKSDSDNWVDDYTLIQTICDYHSNKGVHTHDGKKKATIEQAKLAIMLTESALWYLIHILYKAKRKGRKLETWVKM